MLMVNSRWVGVGYQHFTAASGILQLLHTGSPWSPCSSLFSQLAPCRRRWDNKCNRNHFYNNCHQLYYAVANEKHVAAAFGWIIISEARNASGVLHCCGGSLGVQGSSVVLLHPEKTAYKKTQFAPITRSISWALIASKKEYSWLYRKKKKAPALHIFNFLTCSPLKKVNKEIFFS